MRKRTRLSESAKDRPVFRVSIHQPFGMKLRGKAAAPADGRDERTTIVALRQNQTAVRWHTVEAVYEIERFAVSRQAGCKS